MRPPILTIEQARSSDRRAIEEFGFPSVLLMENAGRGLADVISQTLQRFPHNTQILIFCGSGNNGGDGFVAARHLYLRKHPVHIYLFKEVAQLIGDAQVNANIAQKLRISMSPAGDFLKTAQRHQNNPLLIIDAILGTGFHGEITSPMKDVIDKINNLRRYHNAKVTVISADIPSGVNGDTGAPTNVAIKADITVGFGSIKKGLTLSPSKDYVGKTEFVDIGLPEAVIGSI